MIIHHMKILVNSSKTMQENSSAIGMTEPRYLEITKKLVAKIQAMSIDEIMKFMHCSEKIATKVKEYYKNYGLQKTPALLAFKGDIYKHVEAASYSREDWTYAQEYVLIASGLYGLLRSTDEISLYRLEMADVKKEWKGKLEIKDDVLNLASNEYSSMIKISGKVVSVVFLTNNKQITIYSKYARGAMMNWCVKNKSFDIEKFNELGYSFDKWEENTAYFERKK